MDYLDLKMIRLELKLLFHLKKFKEYSILIGSSAAPVLFRIHFEFEIILIVLIFDCWSEFRCGIGGRVEVQI